MLSHSSADLCVRYLSSFAILLVSAHSYAFQCHILSLRCIRGNPNTCHFNGFQAFACSTPKEYHMRMEPSSRKCKHALSSTRPSLHALCCLGQLTAVRGAAADVRICLLSAGQCNFCRTMSLCRTCFFSRIASRGIPGSLRGIHEKENINHGLLHIDQRCLSNYICKWHS